MKNYNLIPFNQRVRDDILTINIGVRQDWNKCSQKRNNAYYRLHVPPLFDVAGKQRPTNASASVSWTWSSLEEEQSGWGGFRSPRHNKPFHGRQNTSHGAAITKAQRAASLCGATWQTAKTSLIKEVATLYQILAPFHRHRLSALSS